MYSLNVYIAIIFLNLFTCTSFSPSLSHSRGSKSSLKLSNRPSDLRFVNYELYKGGGDREMEDAVGWVELNRLIEEQVRAVAKQTK